MAFRTLWRMARAQRRRWLDARTARQFARWRGHRPEASWSRVIDDALRYAASLRLSPSPETPAYRYATNQSKPVLYASTYAVMLMELGGRLDALSGAERRAWVNYLNGFQSEEDGLFRDPAIACRRAETEDWWGWRHLTFHVLTALAMLRGKPRKPVTWATRFCEPAVLERWLAARDWGTRVSFTGNEIQNLGTCLQFNRELFGDAQAGRAMSVLYEALDARIDPHTGLFGGTVDTPDGLSDTVQAAYHIWLLYLFDRRSVAHTADAVDSLLRTENALGGFGTGLNSSACEDIDTVDPLVRLGVHVPARRPEIRSALGRARDWVLFNRNPDGSFVFRRNMAWRYGHGRMYAPADRGSLFATWFRSLCLKLIEAERGAIEWTDEDGRYPGVQFAPELPAKKTE